ncbi:MAG: GHMP kinase [Winogradskyella sp.]|uniref:GYDIA family GHMP kinase n=1 Tax=Winogradskyella sp. TaxID=1883156 RepID=UPI0017E71D78|nr:GYDIA family GHMP kinase [Winogradskyella sp.]MBT8245580.1 GHMP kinase [Winogradskyella sp.]NNK22850.1 GHMP kinase [Winogradskyella sp.]
MKYFKSNGKLLLTGEYLVLDGAKSLALPTKYGQQLLVEPNQNQKICWRSYDENQSLWFEDNFSIDAILKDGFTSPNEISQRLIQILKSVQALNPSFFKHTEGFNIKTTQDFNRAWGLGTSSTLINNIANWANVDAYALLKFTFGGSGYDIACAQHNSAITYQIVGDRPLVNEVNFNPMFKDSIYFVYLNQKQNSREGIANYKKYKGDLKAPISDINSITQHMISCSCFSEFENLIEKHERIISKIINQKPAKELLFPDFNGAVKSLGAWGGDFVLVISQDNPEAYFKSKGYETILPYSLMIKS